MPTGPRHRARHVGGRPYLLPMPTDQATETFVQDWFDLLSAHAPIERLLRFVSPGELLMEFPERTLRSHSDVRDWYVGVGGSYTDQDHVVENVDVVQSADAARAGTGLAVRVVWRATQISDGAELALRVNQTWRVDHSATGRPVIVEYRVLDLSDL